MTKATTAPQLSPGTVIDGTYTLGTAVRTRGGSVTYEATDLQGARVAVTVYGPDCFMSPVALERGLRELRQLEKVSSPQIVHVIDAGKMPQGGIYEVHEPIRGTTLAELGALPAADVAQVIQDIANAVGAAQKVGVVHRNLGAESVVRVGREIKLFNFAVGDPQGGVSFGSIDSIAPEQVEGRNIDERTLVYNLAALTYRLLKGVPLFTSEDTGTSLLQHAASLPPENSMPAPLFAALAKDPKARPALTKFLGDLGVIVRDFSSGDGDNRDTLDELMHDPDAPQDSAAKQADAPAPAPATKPAAAPVPAAKPAVAPPPAVGPKAAPSVGLPPTIGKPGAPPTLGAPPAVSPPTLSPPSFAPPSLGAPSVAPPTLGAPPVSAPSASSGTPAAKPRTRGWTMFMEATDGEVTSASASAAAPAPTPAVATPAPAPAPTPTPAPAPAPAPAAAPGEVKPSTRGWTMIMDEPSEADAAALALTTPAAATAPPPASPTTRGWTMLEELNDSLPASAPTQAAVTPAAPAPAQPEKLGADGAPSSRGWTMFMEAELQAGKSEDKSGEPDAEPEFFDGQVATETGTVVAFAPSAESPNARARHEAPAENLSDGPEELRSFGSRLRGGDDEAPLAPSPAEPSAPQTSADIPTFTGNSSFDFGGLTPPVKQEPARPQSEPRSPAAAESQLDNADEPASGGSKMVVIGGIVLIIIIVAVVAMMT